MLLSTIAFIFSALLFAQSAHAGLTPDQVVANVELVTRLSLEANVALTKVSTTMPVAQVHDIGQMLVNDFGKIINNVSADIVAMKATHPFNGSMAEPVVRALKTFVSVHQTLLATVIGKHGIFAQFALTAPIVAILRNLEATIDAFAFAMIDLIPTGKKDVNGGKVALDGSVRICITTYGQICIPSLFYPKRMPICVAPF